MTYQEALDFIHGIARFGSKPGLRRVRMLLERMGNPQKRLRFIHVAGTNGKGSTCAMLSHILVKAGYRTGLYISPYVLEFRERIQFDNQMISHSDLALSTERVKGHWDELDAMGEPPTEFEVVVAVAMDYYLRQNCDIVVLEVGMGGRFDATNVIDTPLCSVITSIGLDHTEYLGNTIGEIAFEKCGIIKDPTPGSLGGITVSYPRQDPEALAVIMEQCAQKKNQLLMANDVEIIRGDIDGTDIHYEGLDVHIPLAGEHQVWNTLTVLEAVKALNLSGMRITPEQAAAGIAATRFPSRLEVLGRSPLVLLDGGHNPSAARVLARSLDMLNGRKIHAVVGMFRDKDAAGFLVEIAPLCASITCTSADSPRALPASELAGVARGLCPEVVAIASPKEAFRAAYERCAPTDVLLLCGSLYLASELRPIALEKVEKCIQEDK